MKDTLQLLIEVFTAMNQMHDHQLPRMVEAVGDPKLRFASREVKSVEHVKRHPLYAEEAQNFIGDFESFFSETRKFLVPLTIATQGIESLSQDDAAAVFTENHLFF
jgi:hypothetical protein